MAKRRNWDQKPGGTEPPLNHSVEDLFNHEIDSLHRMAKISDWPPQLSLWKQIVLMAGGKAKNMGRLSIHLRFTARDPRMKATHPLHLIELGALIEPTGIPPLVTYFFAIGEKASQNQCVGLRKLHFDLDLAATSHEYKPIHHMQLPGRMSADLTEVGYQTDAFDFLNPKLDKPRIPSLPTSIAVLAHSALLEYVSTDNRIANFIRSSEWLATVVQSERYIIRTFLDHSLTWLNKTTNDKNSLISYLYRYPSS